MEKQESMGMRLLAKGKRGVVRIVFSRTGVILLLFLFGLWLMLSVMFRFAAWLPHAAGLVTLFQSVLVLILVNSSMDPTAKITWLLVVTLFPVMGGCFYIFTRTNLGNQMFSRRINGLLRINQNALPQDGDAAAAIRRESPNDAALASYIRSTGCFPLYGTTDVRYYPSGEENWAAMLADLERAEKLIYLEYFIVDEGVMWGEILEILARKAAAGLDVRVMYDGTCEFSTLPRDYPERLKRLGIQCRVFAPMTPLVSTYYNYRDHRKIMVIDNRVAYTGGINLADEYINRVEKHGHWKDVGIRLEGSAVQSFHLLFLEMWDSDPAVKEISRFTLPASPPANGAAGYVLPFGDSPFDRDKVGEHVYMDILNRAGRYVHIMSPYLILDGELETALKFAARRGIDVTLILPGIPDKKAVYQLAKTWWPSLMEAGVKIFTYTPGFVHAKVFVSDDIRAFVGTINLDYRSLYHHFECGAYLYRTPCIADIERDFQETLRLCDAVTRERLRGEKQRSRLFGAALKAFAPLL